MAEFKLDIIISYVKLKYHFSKFIQIKLINLTENPHFNKFVQLII